jgi:ribonuclease Z
MAAAALIHEGDVLLFDCGEGTQMRLAAAGIRPGRLRAIFITHLHGDHFFGLPGLLSTLSLLGRTEPLAIIGPEGIDAILRAIPGVGPDQLAFPIAFTDLPAHYDRRTVYQGRDYHVEARPISHRVPTSGFRFQEADRPGRLDVQRANALGITDFRLYRRLKEGDPVEAPTGRLVRPDEVVGPPRRGASFAYVTDTRPCANCLELARGVDLLYHEATFPHAEVERAIATGHSTAVEAARTALEAGAGRLLLCHFSARYPDTMPLVNEARAVYARTNAAVELERYAVGDAGDRPAPGAAPPENAPGWTP